MALRSDPACHLCERIPCAPIQSPELWVPCDPTSRSLVQQIPLVVTPWFQDSRLEQQICIASAGQTVLPGHVIQTAQKPCEWKSDVSHCRSTRHEIGAAPNQTPLQRPL